jgi:hypothetical protein
MVNTLLTLKVTTTCTYCIKMMIIFYTWNGWMERVGRAVVLLGDNGFYQRCIRTSPPPHPQTHLFIKSCSRIASVLLRSSVDVHFAVVILTTLKSFFDYGFGH